MDYKEYLERLDRRLKQLPKKDYEEAMEYFQQYFQDAGGRRMSRK